MRIGIFGGAFDPPHLGHGAAARRCADKVDKLIIVPAGNTPAKSPAASGEHRINMCRLAFPECRILELEAMSEGLSYTADTLRYLKDLYPGVSLCVFIGSDKLPGLDMWHDSAYIRQNADIIPFERNEDVDISSSQLRDMLKNRQGREYLSDGVYSYIIANRLYSAQPDFRWLREKVYARLKPKRVPHVAGVEAEAVRLAEKWGEDVSDARTAAILHDVTKKEELAAQLAICERYGYEPDEEERVSTALLHSKTGALTAKYEFGVSDRVENAIRWHTTGKPDMTRLEKIVYLADMIEPTRTYPGVDDLRREAYIDLDSAVALGLRRTVEHLGEEGMSVHPNSLAALNYIIKGKKK